MIRAVFGSDTTTAHEEETQLNTDTPEVQPGTPAVEQQDLIPAQPVSSTPDQTDGKSSPSAPLSTSAPASREDTPSVSPVAESAAIQSQSSPRSPILSLDETTLPPPISLDSLPGYRDLVTAPRVFDQATSSTSPGAPVSHEHEAEAVNQDNMGLFSAITSNINKPDNNRRTSMNKNSTVKPTTTGVVPATSNTTTTPVGAGAGAGVGSVTGDSHVPATDSSARSIRETPVGQDRPITPAPASVIDDAPTNVGPGETADRAVTPAPRTDRTESINGDNEREVGSPRVPAAAIVAEGRDPVNAPNGIEPGVPVAQSSRASEYTNDQDYPERPAFNEQPSRSYINNRGPGTDAGSIRGSVRNSELPPTATAGSVRNSQYPPTVNESVIEHAPAVLERGEDGSPKVIDYSTASPANLGDREHIGGVTVLPAGGALERAESTYQDRATQHESEQDRATQREYEQDQADRKTERAESVAPTRKSVETERGVDRKSVETERAPTGIVAAVLPRKSVETERVNGSTVNGVHGNEYEKQHQPQPEIRQLMHEGQAYRDDGLVDGQPAYQQPQQYQQQPQQQVVPPQSYAPIAGATAGGMISSAVGQGFRQEQQGQYPQQQQQQQQRFPDQSFANERAMSPGPEMGMQRLAIDPNQQQNGLGGSNVGPSPGPPVAAFKPTAPASPSRQLGASAANGGGLDRNNTYRTGVSRGSTIRRGGAFANGSALSGGGVAESYGREDIHNRNDMASRQLIAAGKPGAAVGRKISVAEKKDAKRMSKLIVKEGHIEAAAVKASMKELESLQKMQRAAAQVSRSGRLEFNRWYTNARCRIPFDFS